MDGWLKGLVAMTCVAVLAALGWWGWSERQAARERAALAQLREWAAADARCGSEADAWKAGDRAQLIQRYGDVEKAEAHLADCIMEPVMRMLGRGSEE